MRNIKKLAFAGGAAVALPLAATASVVTVPVNAAVSPGGSPYNLTINDPSAHAVNANGGPDFAFTVSASDLTTVSSLNGTEFVLGSGGNPADVQKTTVGPSSTFSTGSGQNALVYPGGNFHKNGDLGFEVPVNPASGHTYDYGYVSLTNFSGGGLGINSYTYDPTGAPVAVPEIPEPSTLALFAAGAVGLGVLRRRRKSLKA